MLSIFLYPFPILLDPNLEQRSRDIDINNQANDGSTAVILAAKLCINGILQHLIKKGADINLCDNLGRSPLLWSVAVHNHSATKILIEDKANINLQDNTVISNIVNIMNWSKIK